MIMDGRLADQQEQCVVHPVFHAHMTSLHQRLVEEMVLTD